MVGGGGNLSFCPSSSLSLILCTCSSSDCFDTDEQLFVPEQLLPGNWVTGLPMKITVVTRTADYPVTFGTGP